MTSTLTSALRARNAYDIRRRYQICLIHPFDPRGEKVGGLKTYIRDFISFHPADTALLFVGIDSKADLQAREAARSIRSSVTGQFFLALLRHFGPFSRLIRSRRCTIDLRRVELSWLPVVLRLPFVQMLQRPTPT